ncbi:hypothetical protein C4577_00615 [Candidatus Parcubacteria bacterium]|nr:MAG: hypothetical protein C4577_00615 [Candidatus Parcubacteria bacterium]
MRRENAPIQNVLGLLPSEMNPEIGSRREVLQPPFSSSLNPPCFYEFSQEMELSLELIQIMEKIAEMRGEEGMEVFFSIEGMDKYVAKMIYEIQEKPQERHFLVIMGGTGAGKEALGSGIIQVFNQVLAPLLEEKEARLMLKYMSNSDSLKNAQEVGQMPQDKWVNEVPPEDLPKYTQAGTDQMVNAVQWLQEMPGKDKKGKTVTAVGIYEVLGITDAHPEDPNDFSFPRFAEGKMPIKLNMGGGLVQMLANEVPENHHVIALTSDLNVIMKAAAIRGFIEEAYKMYKSGNFTDRDLKLTLSLLEELGMKIDDPNITIEDLVKSNGGRDVAQIVYGAIDQVLIRFLPEILWECSDETRLKFAKATERKRITSKYLEKNPEVRKELERGYMMILLRSWGISEHNVFIGENNEISVNKETEPKEKGGKRREEGKITRTHKRGLIKKLAFPPPWKREKDMRRWQRQRKKTNPTQLNGLHGEFYI